MVQCLFFQWQRAHLLWWPYCGYTKSDCCSQQGCDTPAQCLIGLIGYSYQQVATSSPEAGLQRTSRLSMLGPEQFGDGWPTGKWFPGAHEWGQNVQKRHVLVCEGSLCPRELLDVSGPGLGEAGRYKGHHCLEGCCFRPSASLQFTKRGCKHFTRCSESFNGDSGHPERSPNEHHKGIQRSLDHKDKGQIYVKYCLFQSIIPVIYAVET